MEFNEDSHSKNMQEFIIETEIFDMHEEVNGRIKEERDNACEHGSKCADLFEATQETLEKTVGVELIDVLS